MSRENVRGAAFLLGAVLLAGLAFSILSRSWVEDEPAATPQALRTKPVVVASREIRVGRTLAAGDLHTEAWPADLFREDFESDPAELEGSVARVSIGEGMPVVQSGLLAPGSPGSLEGQISPAHRAMTVKINPSIGVAGFVLPGSRVDVLATLSRSARESDVVAKTILQDVKVLATDQRLDRSPGDEIETADLVTLEVTLDQAERLLLSTNEGRLHLVLRAGEATGPVETRGATAESLLAQGRRPRRAAPARTSRKSPAVSVVRGVVETSTRL